MTYRAVDIIKRASEEEKQTERATHEMNHARLTSGGGVSSLFWAAGERWLSKLPEGKRAKLRSSLSAAETDADKVQLLMSSAETDTTKVRATEKRALLDIAAAELVVL